MTPHYKKSVLKPPPTLTTRTPSTLNIASSNQDQIPATPHNYGSKGSWESPRISNPSDQNKTGKSSMQFSTHFSPTNVQNPFTWNWDISDNDELDIPKQEFTLDLSFLQNSKKGLGFSANCREWLEKLNIYSWHDLVILSPMKMQRIS